jgi:hypothetical protein
MPAHRVPLADRLWSRVEKTPAGCWEWTGNRNALGYGIVTVQHSKRFRAHRVAWELTRGPIPDGMVVCHRCDNPPCCNPEHLFLGTHDENMADMVAKDRHARGERNGHARMTSEQVREIREARARGEPLCLLAERYGISETGVCNIAKGRSWGHAPMPEGSTTGRTPFLAGEAVANAKLTADDVLRLRALCRSGWTIKAAAALVPSVSDVAVRYAVRGITWKHLPMDGE